MVILSFKEVSALPMSKPHEEAMEILSFKEVPALPMPKSN